MKKLKRQLMVGMSRRNYRRSACGAKEGKKRRVVECDEGGGQNHTDKSVHEGTKRKSKDRKDTPIASRTSLLMGRGLGYASYHDLIAIHCLLTEK